MPSNAPRAVIAGTNSGCGKTTMVCALLQVLQNRGLSPASFKVGPDYIDPMFHTRILGVPSINLDLYFSEEEPLRSLFLRHASRYNVIEGVMGFFDGMDMDSTRASAYHVARTVDAPVLLTVNVRGMALSAAAIVKGFMTLREGTNVRGVLLNRCSPMTYPRLKETIERECGVPVLGYLPTGEEFSLESRYLGLVTAAEVEGLKQKMQLLAEQAEKSLDIEGILRVMEAAPDLKAEPERTEPVGPVRIAVARDKAFCFYYQANLELLEDLGAEIVPFSPLEDAEVPPCDGMYLGGGYPELYAEQLSQNHAMLQSVRSLLESGLPTVAECGGFMYLCRAIGEYPMAGFIDTVCENKKKLSRFGYAAVTAETESLLFAPGDSIRAHEFHYWDAAASGDALKAEKPSGRNWRCGYVSPTLYAGYPHLYLPSCPSAARRFIEKCLERKQMP